MARPRIVFATAAYEYLKEALCHLSGCDSGRTRREQSPDGSRRYELGEVERVKYPDGELGQRVLSEVHGKRAIIIAGTISEADTTELFDLACGLVQLGARSLRIVIPFFGYQTMERQKKPGEIVTAKTRALLFKGIPVPPSGIRVHLFNPHNPTLPSFFEYPVLASEMPWLDLAVDMVRSLGLDDYCISTVDSGRSKTVDQLAEALGKRICLIGKARESGDTTHVTHFTGDCAGKDVVVYDDMVRTGGSLLGAVKELVEREARRIFVVTGAGVLPGESLDRIKKHGRIERILCTNAHAHGVKLAGGLVQTRCIAPLIHEFLQVGEQYE